MIVHKKIDQGRTYMGDGVPPPVLRKKKKYTEKKLQVLSIPLPIPNCNLLFHVETIPTYGD